MAIPMPRHPMGPRERALEELVHELESLRVQVPEAIMEGEAEEVLLDAYMVLSSHVRSIEWPVKRPYTGLHERVKLLVQLAQALRLRMQRTGSPYITGVDYFTAKLDELIIEARALAGLHPYMPPDTYTAV